MLAEGVAFLKERGLNLYAVLDCKALPADVVGSMERAAVPLRDYSRLVLIGNGGRDFWEALKVHGHETEHPVDHFSRKVTEQFIERTLDAAPVFWLFPSDLLAPLQRLGEVAGWAHPSPLGLGISPKYGLWFAYRAAFLTQTDLPLISEPPASSPCDACVEKPCMGACPAAAVGEIGRFDVSACVSHRLAPRSGCADRCLSRLACPVAPEHRYTLEQIRYHYGRSLETIRL